LEDPKIRELLDLVQARIAELDDHFSNRSVSLFEDRVVLSRKSHFVVSRTGRTLARIDLDEIVHKVEESHAHWPSRKAEEWFQEGMRHSSGSRPRSSHLALAAFREALRQDPGLTGAYLQIGKLHFRERNLIDAERSLRLALTRDPYNSEALYFLGRVMEEVGCREEGIRYYEKALETDPKFRNAYYRLGRIYVELQLYERAQKHWDRYMALDPHSPRSATLRRYLAQLTAATRD
jgi:tetratricopeptide (TPR) repeat protein